MDKFWLVWNPDANPPMHRHPEENLAKAEAQRLARTYPGQTFFVLESIGAARKVDVEYIDLNKEEMPF